MRGPGARAAIEETPAGITIEIGPVRHWLVMPVVVVLVGAWAFAEHRAFRLFFDVQVEPARAGLVLLGLALASLGAWSAAGYLLVRELVWWVLATETVSVGAGLLRIRREAPIFRMAREFELAAVRDLHLDARAGRLRFHAGRRRWAFGHTLLAEEAERVLDRIRTRFAAIVRAP